MRDLHQFALNSSLLGVIGFLAAFLAWGAFRRPEELPPPPPPPGTADGAVAWGHPVLEPFPEGRDLFRPVVTPRPTPTRVIPPTPAPRPPQPPPWQILLIIGDSVQIRDQFGIMHYLREGDVLEQVRIVEVDWELGRVRIQSLENRRQWTLGVGDSRRGG